MNDTEFRSNLNPYIYPDETVLWKGVPERKGNIITSRDIILIPLGLAWTGFTLFWEISAVKSGAGLFFSIWGIPFIVAGLYLLAGRFIHKAYLRNKTYYMITDKRIFIKAGRKIKIFNGDALPPPMDIVIHRNGNGTITFTEELIYSRRRSYTYTTLENLPDYLQAEKAINAMDRY